MEILQIQILTELNGSRLAHLPLILAILLGIFGGYYLKCIHPNFKKNVPPGNHGFPLIGETISYLKALKQDKVNEWIQDRESKYGSVFKTSLIGANTVILNGLGGNRFILGGSDNGLVHSLPTSAARIIGQYSLSGLSGPAHKLIRGAIMSFLKPESIQRYVKQMNSLVRQELLKELSGKDCICVVPLMKKITFNVTCTLLFGLPGGKELDQLLEDYTLVLNGAWSIPFNFPGTSVAKALKARARICKYFSLLIEEKKHKLGTGKVGYQDDIISKFLSENLSEDEIFDNIISLMIASHDTTAILVTLCIRQFARDVDVLNKVLWSAPGTHMDENIFKDPKKFDPARFENSSGIPP
ncbi:hypothetical protein ACH5RR_003974 [Cinchona calisaya]|uniref:Cytochrome P450 n=1 Tax=Cinchona calisaya TaxID=153742 RepID=A0ABD3AWL7_9GENT